MAVNTSDGGETGATLTTTVSNNATASLPSPEEAALQALWLQVFEMTSSAPLASAVTLPSSAMPGFPQPPPSPRSYRAPRTPTRHLDGPPTPGVSQTRKRSKKNAHWQLNPSELHRGIYEAMRCHSADWWIKYYLRANNWDVDSALDDLLQHVHWRQQIAKIDTELLPWGEAGALRTVQDPKADPNERKIAEGFLSVLQNYETRILKGRDHLGRITCFVKVKNHRGGVYPAESYERYSTWHVEMSRMMMPETRGDGILLLDLEGYKISNMDYRPLKIITKIMTKYYPQGLGDVIFHRAPALFTAVWHLIKTVVREDYYAHIHCTKDVSELQRYIPFESIPKEMGGGDDMEFRYEEPDLDDPANGGGDESVQMRRDYERTALREQQIEYAQLFEETTKEWIDASRRGRETQGLRTLREKYQRDILATYWKLDPYIRSRTIYDRLGWIRAPEWVDE